MVSIQRTLLLAVLTLVLGGLGGYNYSQARAEAEAERVAKLAAEDHEKQVALVAAANEQNRAAERAHALELQKVRDEYHQQNDKARSEDAATIAGLQSGNKRLRLQVASCSAGPATAPGAGRGVDEEASAELAPATAAALYGIAADGDQAIRDLTALQGWAESAMKLCKGTQP